MALSEAIIIIDPQIAFASETGSFSKAFDELELRPLRIALEELNQYCKTPAAAGIPGIVVRSEYVAGQFAEGRMSLPLSQLCVPGANADCQWADGFVPPP